MSSLKEILKKVCIGFVSNKGIMLDLDDISFLGTKTLAEALTKRYKLEGYLIMKSSKKHYHVIFNRKNLSWKTTLKIIFSVNKALNWAIQQAKHGNMTLRISQKNGVKPEIILKKGKTDKLIKEYLETYKLIEGLENA